MHIRADVVGEAQPSRKLGSRPMFCALPSKRWCFPEPVSSVRCKHKPIISAFYHERSVPEHGPQLWPSSPVPQVDRMGLGGSEHLVQQAFI